MVEEEEEEGGRRSAFEYQRVVAVPKISCL